MDIYRPDRRPIFNSLKMRVILLALFLTSCSSREIQSLNLFPNCRPATSQEQQTGLIITRHLDISAHNDGIRNVLFNAVVIEYTDPLLGNGHSAIPAQGATALNKPEPGETPATVKIVEVCNSFNDAAVRSDQLDGEFLP